MGWFSRLTGSQKKVDIPSDLWKKCPGCGEVLLIKDLARSFFLCSKCDQHLRMPIWDRIALLSDENSFVELDKHVSSTDPLGFVDSKPYLERIKKAIDSTDSYEAVICGLATVQKHPVLLGVMNFQFMGGSMGSGVGEKITRLFERGADEKKPVVIVSSSGGARMQEGILSLMQMAKTSQAVRLLADAKMPYISVLSDPTTGGVSASFASLGDINLAEPKALIGFAGPRVIEQTIRQKLPDGFQRAEFVLDHGMVDAVVHRKKMKQTIAQLLYLLL